MRYFLQGRYLENGGEYFEEFETQEEQLFAVAEIKEAWEEYTKRNYSKQHGVNVVNYSGLQICYEIDDYETAEA